MQRTFSPFSILVLAPRKKFDLRSATQKRLGFLKHQSLVVVVIIEKKIGGNTLSTNDSRAATTATTPINDHNDNNDGKWCQRWTCPIIIVIIIHQQQQQHTRRIESLDQPIVGQPIIVQPVLQSSASMDHENGDKQTWKNNQGTQRATTFGWFEWGRWWWTDEGLDNNITIIIILIIIDSRQWIRVDSVPYVYVTTQCALVFESIFFCCVCLVVFGGWSFLDHSSFFLFFLSSILSWSHPCEIYIFRDLNVQTIEWIQSKHSIDRLLEATVLHWYHLSVCLLSNTVSTLSPPGEERWHVTCVTNSEWLNSDYDNNNNDKWERYRFRLIVTHRFQIEEFDE